MADIYLSSYLCESSQGDIEQTLDAIEYNNIKIGKKTVATLDETIEIPYFTFERPSCEDPREIYQRIKETVDPLLQSLSKEKRMKTAVIVGTSLVDQYIVESIEATVYEELKKPFATQKRSIDSFAYDLANEYGLHPYTMTVTTACTSSANALFEARNLIECGMVDEVLVIGVEIFSQMMSDGFSSMKLLSAEEQKPFDIKRDGLILGEAIAAVMVTKQKTPWKLLGGYSNCNSYNITSVAPEGKEYAQVMEEALKSVSLSANQITALKAHATSTPTNDLSEINAIKSVFSPEVVFSGIKPYLGHTLGACGILEIAVVMGCIDRGFFPGTINHKEAIISEYIPLKKHKKIEDGIFMCNYFGFGGNNTSVIIEKGMK